MKRLQLYALAAIALVVLINFAIRGATPDFHPDTIIPALAEHEILAGILAGFAKPGIYGLWNIGLNVNTRAALIIALVMSWWVWLALVRTLWFGIGRAIGVVCAADFYAWLRAVPPWRQFHLMWLRFAIWHKQQFRYVEGASAAWASFRTTMARPYTRGDMIYLGRLWGFGIGFLQSVGLKDKRHVNVWALTGAGKTTWGIAWFGMLDEDASSLAVDCDGQIVNAVGATLERDGHDVVNLDPYGLSKFPAGCWNPLEELTRAATRHGRQAVVRFAATLAEALVSESNEYQKIFCETARHFVMALCLYVWLLEKETFRNLIRVWDLLSRGTPEFVREPKQDPFDALLDRMILAPVLKDDGCNGEITAAIARGGSLMKSCQRGKDGNAFKSTAMSALSWLSFPEVAEMLRRSDVAMEDLKTGNPCIFVVVPLSDMQKKLSGLVRALVMMGGYAFENMPGQRSIPSLWFVDEAANLGRIEMLETASPVFRRYGIRLVLIMQDLGRWKQAYPDSWESFIGNAAVNLLMSGSHQSTSEYFSKVLGSAVRKEIVVEGNAPPRVDKRNVPLMDPNQLGEFLDPARGQMIAFLPGKGAMRLAHEPYYKALPVWRYEPDPNFKEHFLRRLTRRVLAWLWLRKPPVGPRRGPKQ